MRKLFNRGRSTSGPVENSKSLVTIGSAPVRANGGGKKFRNPTDQGMSFTTVHAGNDWTRLEDRDSDTSREDITGIRAEYTYEVEMSRLSKVSEGN